MQCLPLNSYLSKSPWSMRQTLEWVTLAMVFGLGLLESYNWSAKPPGPCSLKTNEVILCAVITVVLDIYHLEACMPPPGFLEATAIPLWHIPGKDTAVVSQGGPYPLQPTPWQAQYLFPKLLSTPAQGWEVSSHKWAQFSRPNSLKLKQVTGPLKEETSSQTLRVYLRAARNLWIQCREQCSRIPSDREQEHTWQTKPWPLATLDPLLASCVTLGKFLGISSTKLVW